MPKISVITPTMWRETLCDVARDLSDQEFTDFEWVIVPDSEGGSIDDIPDEEMLGGAIATSCTPVIYLPNGLDAGQKGNPLRDLGIEYATGEWMTFLDDDDRADTGWLWKFAQHFDEADIVIQNGRNPKRELRNLQQGNISGQCFAVRAEIARRVRWADPEDRPCADWRWIQGLHEIVLKERIVQDLKGDPQVFVNGRK